jgi:hypothetical protein
MTKVRYTGPPEPRLKAHRLARRKGLLPESKRVVLLIRVNRIEPASPVSHVLAPALVGEIDAPLAIGGPHHVREQLGDVAIALRGFLQLFHFRQPRLDQAQAAHSEDKMPGVNDQTKQQHVVQSPKQPGC